MTYIMQLKGKVDVINMSYGEHSQWSNAGKIGELIGEVVNKHGVIWAVSAGNAGNIYFRFVHIFFRILFAILDQNKKVDFNFHFVKFLNFLSGIVDEKNFTKKRLICFSIFSKIIYVFLFHL